MILQFVDWRENQPELRIDGAFRTGLVSVIVPCFNRARLVRRGLNSVIAQTFRPIELIVVDDGSTDNTIDTVKDWMEGVAAEDGVTFKFIVKSNGGAASARNAGLFVSEGEFVQYLDSDDLISPDKIRAHMDAILDDDCDFVWSPMSLEFGRLETDGTWFSGGKSEIYFDGIFPDQACVGLYRRSLIKAAGLWDQTLPTREDLEYRYRIQLNSKKYKFVPGIRYRAFVHKYGRENDKYSGPVDIKSYIDFLDSVGKRGGPKEIRRSIGLRYRENAERAMDIGEKVLAIRALRGVVLTVPTYKDYFRAKVLLMLCHSFGTKPTLLALRLTRKRFAFAAQK